LGQNDEYHFKILNSQLGIGSNAYYSSQSLINATRANSNASLSDKFAPFLGKPLSIETNMFPHLAVPYFAIGAYLSLDSSIEYRDPVNPEFYINERDDWGVTTGMGFSLEDRLFFGASIHYFKRTVINEEITGDTFLNTNLSSLTNYAKKGKGLGLNLGLQWRQAVNDNSFLNFGISVDDLGSTRIKNSSLTLEEPAYQQQSVNAGFAYTFESDFFDWKVLLDGRHLDRSVDYAGAKQVFMGAEVSVFKVDLRGGFYEGYWTAGTTLRFLPLFDITFTTYAEELDRSPGLRENRIFMLSITSGLQLKHFGKKKQKYTLDNL
jgi:hypothetical protein